MKPGSLLVLRGPEIEILLRGKQLDIFDTIRSAYILADVGDVAMPNCPFLRFPTSSHDRIIAKPAYLGGEFKRAGIKWVSSFPRNGGSGKERASASLILNSTESGEPLAFMEGSLINLYRTAASAALAAQILLGSRRAKTLGLVGCGPVNLETFRFLLLLLPDISRVVLYDVNPKQSKQFAECVARDSPEIVIQIALTVAAAFEADLISIATTSNTPYFVNTESRHPVILNISLRDLQPTVILNSHNVVDDIDHVCSNNTSLHLTELQVGHRQFIYSTIGKLLRGHPAPDHERPIIFSPFGLGILDLATADLVFKLALRAGVGLILENFIPDPRIPGRVD